LLVASEFLFITSTFFNTIQSNILRIGGISVNFYKIVVFWIFLYYQHIFQCNPIKYFKNRWYFYESLQNFCILNFSLLPAHFSMQSNQIF